jgi:hypothetical protein
VVDNLGVRGVRGDCDGVVGLGDRAGVDGGGSCTGAGDDGEGAEEGDRCKGENITLRVTVGDSNASSDDLGSDCSL